MLKKRKYTIILVIIFMLGIIMFPNKVNAAYVDMAYEIGHYSDTNTYSITKTVEGQQKVKVTEAYTALTNPCPNCQVTFKPYREGYGGGEGFIAKMGQTKAFGLSSTNYKGKYHLALRRFDLTALPTMVLFRWTYQ